MTIIPFAKPYMGEAEIEAARRVLASGVLSGGPEGKAFEQEWAEYLGAGDSVLVSNGTTALEAALLALKDRNPYQSEVIVPGMTFNATSSSVLAAGLKPVFADIGGYSNTIDPKSIKELINKQTLGIIAVDLYGLMADYEALNDLNLPIIEDAAQAHGSLYKGMRPGSLDLFSEYDNLFATTFSFYATKNITTGGEGGAVIGRDWEVNEHVRLLREHGSPEKYEHMMPGHNWRVTELQAAIGREQLRQLPDWQMVRSANAFYLTEHLHLYIDKPYVDENKYTHGWHQYVVRIYPEWRDQFIKFLKDRGVIAGIHYPVAEPDQPMYDYQHNVTPRSRMLAKEAVSLPVGPWVGHEELQTIVQVSNDAIEALK